MKKAKKVIKKETKKAKPAKKEKAEEMSVDDAFADDEGVEYAPAKPHKEKKKKGMTNGEMEEELDEVEDEADELGGIINGKGESDELGKREITFAASKPLSKIKKGDKITIDGAVYEVDAHYVLIDHGTTKEMAVEIFNVQTDKDYQLRYFDDQVESTIDFYELQEILYIKKPFKKISW